MPGKMSRMTNLLRSGQDGEIDLLDEPRASVLTEIETGASGWAKEIPPSIKENGVRAYPIAPTRFQQGNQASTTFSGTPDAQRCEEGILFIDPSVVIIIQRGQLGKTISVPGPNNSCPVPINPFPSRSRARYPLPRAESRQRLRNTIGIEIEGEPRLSQLGRRPGEVDHQRVFQGIPQP